MNNFIFNFKSNWFEDGIIKDMGFEIFFLYLIIRKYELRQNIKLMSVSVELLYEEISKYHLSNGRKYTRPDIKNKLLELRRKNIIVFDGRIKSNEQLLMIECLDLPSLDVSYKPVSDNDHFVIVETKFVDQIIDSGLKEEHVTLYLYLKKFNKNSKPSYQTIGKILGIDKDTAQRYGRQLEKNKIIMIKKDHAQTGRKQNLFYVSDSRGHDKFIKSNDEHFTNIEVKDIKKKLKNNGIKVTKRAYDDISHLFKYLTSEENEKLSELHNKHVVYAIEHLYFNLKGELEDRKNGADGEMDGEL